MALTDTWTRAVVPVVSPFSAKSIVPKLKVLSVPCEEIVNELDPDFVKLYQK
jgi:hypothetical protein